MKLADATSCTSVANAGTNDFLYTILRLPWLSVAQNSEVFEVSLEEHHLGNPGSSLVSVALAVTIDE
jgi:hypothetical protein